VPGTKIAVAGISKRYTDGLVVFERLSVEVHEDEFFCILGPSGCGKTTLLRLIDGLLPADGGEIRIDGERVTGPRPDVVMVFQHFGLFPWKRLDQNVAYGLKLRGVPQAETAERVARYIKLVGLEGFERAYPHELSGGMKQRLEVARALAVNPDMLFLDEPFGSLDSITRLGMRSELLRIWELERKTILFVTHDIEEAVQLADRVVVLSSRPARIRRIVEIDIPHPRDISSARYLELRDGIFEEIGLAHKV